MNGNILMTIRIEVAFIIEDTRAIVRKKQLQQNSFPQVTDVQIVDVYIINKNFSEKELARIASMLANPVTQKFSIQKTHPSVPSAGGDEKRAISPPWEGVGGGWSHAIEIGFLPGVTDNVAHTAKESIEDLLKVQFNENEDVYTSQVTYVSGDISDEDAKKIGNTLANPLIQRIHIKSFEQYKKDDGMDSIVAQVTIQKKITVTEINLK